MVVLHQRSGWLSRLHRLRDQLCQPAPGYAGDTTAPTNANIAGNATMHSTPTPSAAAPGLRPLSQSQIEQFCRNGHLVLHITEVPDEVHARIYEHAYINQKGSVFTTGQRAAEARAADALLPELTQDQRAMLRQDFAAVSQSPTILGAMHSLLGCDFVGTVDELQGATSAPNVVASVPSALVSTTGDNQHHKDGTGLSVREHRFRSVGYW